MGIREDIEKETSEEIARRLIFDGRVSDEDIAAGCGITPERVQELISEVAHETRELLQELRKMLFDIRKPELSDEDRRDILLQIVMLLRLMIDNEICEEPEQAEIRDYIRYHDAADIRLTLLQIYPESEDYTLLYHGQEFLHNFMNSLFLNKKREGRHGLRPGNKNR